MDWQTDTGKEALNRIAALLLALANLADRAARSSRPVRWLVLWGLWQANAVARDFVAGSASDSAGRPWSPAPIPVQFGSDPADAASLARSLRWLALMVRRMAAQLHRLSPSLLPQTSSDVETSACFQAIDRIAQAFSNAARFPVVICDTS